MNNMTINDAIVRYNFLTKVIFRNENESLSKELRLKLIKFRLELKKIKDQFEEEIKNLTEELKTDEFKRLSSLESKTEDEIQLLNKEVDLINEEYSLFVNERSKDFITINCKFTDEEFEEILITNLDNSVEINNTTISAPDFLEALYSLFVV